MTYNRKFGVEFEIVELQNVRLAHALFLNGIKFRWYGLKVGELPKEFDALTVHRALESDDFYDENMEDYSVWNIKEDCSVYGGFELVSPPLKGPAGFAELRKVCQILESLGAKVNETCGLHVHLDASGLDAHEVNTIILRYAKWEDQIDAFFHANRRENNSSYCLSMKSVAKNITDMNILDNETWEYDRYWKVNPEALDDHGTLEFRQHNGAYKAKTVITWIKFLMAFVERSKALSEAKQSNGRKLVDRSLYTGVPKKVVKDLKARAMLDSRVLNHFV